MIKCKILCLISTYYWYFYVTTPKNILISIPYDLILYSIQPLVLSKADWYTPLLNEKICWFPSITDILMWPRPKSMIYLPWEASDYHTTIDDSRPEVLYYDPVWEAKSIIYLFFVLNISVPRASIYELLIQFNFIVI